MNAAVNASPAAVVSTAFTEYAGISAPTSFEYAYAPLSPSFRRIISDRISSESFLAASRHFSSVLGHIPVNISASVSLGEKTVMPSILSKGKLLSAGPASIITGMPSARALFAAYTSSPLSLASAFIPYPSVDSTGSRNPGRLRESLFPPHLSRSLSDLAAGSGKLPARFHLLKGLPPAVCESSSPAKVYQGKES